MYMYTQYNNVCTVNTLYNFCIPVMCRTEFFLTWVSWQRSREAVWTVKIWTFPVEVRIMSHLPKYMARSVCFTEAELWLTWLDESKSDQFWWQSSRFASCSFCWGLTSPRGLKGWFGQHVLVMLTGDIQHTPWSWNICEWLLGSKKRTFFGKTLEIC